MAQPQTSEVHEHASPGIVQPVHEVNVMPEFGVVDKPLQLNPEVSLP
jgi:hypothetical protein